MICQLCTGRTSRKRVRKQHWLQGRLYLIDNVEAEVCNECGERYFHAKTLDSINRLLEGKHKVKARLQVEVVSL